MWFTKLIKQFFFWIDKIIYNFISSIYDLLITIARTSVLTQADIADMADRIYKLLAIFMIFKVTLSLITYVVNPDDFSDKSKGVSKLGTNIIISLAMLILTPYIFSYAYQLQTIILEDNSLATLIFGGSTDEEKSFFNSAGDDMAYITMSAFISPNLSLGELHECSLLIDPDTKKFNEVCKEKLSDLIDGEFFTTNMLNNYVAGVENNSLGLLFRQELVLATAEDNTEFVMDYKFIFSTVVGVVVILLLVTFCMDVAVRSIKLAFLQLVAPIPILSYVDPKSGKDGMFKKWYEMCFKTYLSLFVRLLALYFAVFIISKVASLKMVDLVDGSYQTNALVAIFIIIGALMFAKQLPKMLEGLGIKLDGDGFTLNPLKKIEKDAIGGKQLAKIGNTGLKYAGRTAKGFGTAAAVGGAALVTGHGFRGMGKAFGGAMKGEKFGKNFTNSYTAAKERHKELDEMRANGISPGSVRKEKMYNFFHGSSRAERVKQVEDKSKGIQSSYETIKNQAVACDADDNTTITRNGRVIRSAKTISKELDEMKKTQIDRGSFSDKIGRTAQQQYDEAVASKTSKLEKLESRKKESMDKTSQINLDISRLKREQASLDRSDFSSDVDFYAARADYTQRLAVLDEQKKAYDITAIDKEISSVTAERDALDVSSFTDEQSITAEEQYQTALSEQDRLIRQKESDLEERIKALANGEIEVRNASGEKVASASKVIEDAKETMIKLTESVNKTGEELDEKFEGISVKVKPDGSFDVVNAMKQSKGTAAQATTGKLSDIATTGQYAKKRK